MENMIGRYPPGSILPRTIRHKMTNGFLFVIASPRRKGRTARGALAAHGAGRDMRASRTHGSFFAAVPQNSARQRAMPFMRPGKTLAMTPEGGAISSLSGAKSRYSRKNRPRPRHDARSPSIAVPSFEHIEQLLLRFHSEFAIDMGGMGLHRSRRDEELVGDIRQASPLR